MKAFRLSLFLAFFLTNSQAAFAASMSLGPGETKIVDVPLNDQGKYELVLDSLTLGEGSVFYLSQNLVGKNVSLVIKKISVFGKAYIAQEPEYNTARVIKSSERLSIGVIDNQLSRAKKGADGPAYHQDHIQGREQRGADGKNGQDGSAGVSTVAHLSLDLGIVSLDELRIVLIAQNGGDGGNGGNAQGGSHAGCNDPKEAAGNGGRGGNGGKGGLPGNVGSVQVNWNSEYSIPTFGAVPAGIRIDQVPGIVGAPGNGGLGGAGGNGKNCPVLLFIPAYTRGAGSPGENGRVGKTIKGGDEYYFLGERGDIFFQRTRK